MWPTWRVQGIPLSFDRVALVHALRSHPDLACAANGGSTDAQGDGNNDNGAEVHTLAPALQDGQVATVRFHRIPSQLERLAKDGQLSLDLVQPKSLESCNERTAFLQTATVTIDDHFHGLTVLYSPSPERCIFDILAVSGLGSHPFGSFAHKKDGHMWLTDTLPKDIPTGRVMIYGYGSAVQNSTSFAELDDLAGSFQLALSCILEEEPRKHIVLIGHSLGGLLIKEALIRFSESYIELGLLWRILGCVFFGVPNDGMKIESLIPMVCDQPNRSLIQSIRDVNSHVLRIQRRNFSRVIAKVSLDMFCFFETETSPTAIEVDGEWKMEGPRQCLVSQSSATSCLPQNSPPDRAIAVPRTHSGLVKFAHHDFEYFKVRHILNKICSRADRAGGSEDHSATREDSDIERVCLPKELTRTDPTVDDLRKCLQDMRVKNPGDVLSEIQDQRGERVKGTCEWILNRKEFSIWWAEDNSRLLRLTGSPGIGKTIMSTFLVDELRAKIEKTPGRVLAYFFCDDKDKDRSEPTAILRSLIWQLLRQRNMLFRHIKSDFEAQRNTLFEDFYALWRILKGMLVSGHAGEVFILIDALDECGNSQRQGFLQREPFVRRIKELFESSSTTGKFKFLVTCRPEMDIEGELKGVGDLLQMDSVAINDDLSKYIDFKVDGLTNRIGKPYPQELKEEVRNILRDEAGGTFLWVSLMVAELGKVLNHKVKEKLKNPPRKLDDIYAQILGRIPLEDQEVTQFVLRCMVAARRPLRKIEIQTAFATSKAGSILPRQELAVYEDIYSACSSILYVGYTSNEDDATITFCHQSVKDFLLREGPGSEKKWYHTGRAEANLLIFKACWTYLSAEKFDHGRWVVYRKEGTEQLRKARFHELRPHFQEYPFLEYSSEKWENHAIASYPALQNELRMLAIDLTKAPTLRDAWLLCTAHEGQEATVKLLLERDANIEVEDDSYGRTPISQAATNGHEATVRLLLENGANIKAKNWEGQTPLHWATKYGHEAIVRLLLEKDADIEAKGSYDQTPLSIAISGGHEAIVSLLLERKANIEAEDRDRRTPLSIAALAEKGPIIRLLLEKGANIEAKNWEGQTPLHQAAMYGHEAIVRLLLENGADIEAKDGFENTWTTRQVNGRQELIDNNTGRTPLSYAAMNGQAAIVRLLLEWDANIEAKDRYGQRLWMPWTDGNGGGRTPLLWAVANGDKATVRLLLEKGAKIEVEYVNSMTPLSWATMIGHEDIVRLLLESGANIEAKDGNGQTPLHWAAGYEREAIVRLREEGADIDVEDGDGLTRPRWAIDLGHAVCYSSPTSLSQAVGCGHEAIVKLLLEKDANIESKDRYNQTPILRAAKCGLSAIVRLLLEKGANIEEDEDGRTLLHWAARYGDETTARLLLKKGTNIESKDRYGQTPLSQATQYGHTAIVTLLFEQGANIEEKGDGWMLLHWAAQNRDKTTAKLLLEKGANIEAGDWYDQTPLSKAAEKGDKAIVKLLLKRGANIETKDRLGRTPLSHAARSKHEAIVRLLLKKDANIESKDEDNTTPLLYATMFGGNIAIVRLLLKKGANIKAKDRDGQTSLHWAVWNTNEAIVRLLLIKGANIEVADNSYGRTPLHWATMHGNIAIVRLMLESGANIEAKDRDGQTPLHWATRQRHKAIIKLLLEKDANIESKDRNGQTPLHWAARDWDNSMSGVAFGVDWHDDTIRLLLEKGADIKAKDEDGNIPLHYATINGRKGIVKLLLERDANIEAKDEHDEISLSRAR